MFLHKDMELLGAVLVDILYSTGTVFPDGDLVL